MNKTIACDCCEGIESVTPLSVRNRPGLDELRYRIGTHSSFFQSMLARLTTLCRGEPKACRTGKGEHLLRELLTTRSPEDPAIALLDGWALVADVLTFYQERIANEGFLRTATEARSLYELSRLVGYRPRPGVASSVYLAFEVEPPPSVTTATGLVTPGAAKPDPDVEILLPQGTQVRSTPAPGTDDQPQTFETSREFRARPAWNALKPRLTQLPEITEANALDLTEFYFRGTGLRLSKNDHLMLVLDPKQSPFPYQIKSVKEYPERQLTHVELQTDEFSITRLIDALADVVIAFIEAPILGRLLKPDFHRNVLATHLLKRVENARTDKLSLTGVDKAFDDLTCHEVLAKTLPPNGVTALLPGNRTLRQVIEAQTDWFSLLKTLFRSPHGTLVDTSKILESDYLDRHSKVNDYSTRVKASLFTAGDPSTGFVQRLAETTTLAEATLEAKVYFLDKALTPFTIDGAYQTPDITIAANLIGQLPDTQDDVSIARGFRANVNTAVNGGVFLTGTLIGGPPDGLKAPGVTSAPVASVTKTALESAFNELKVSFGKKGTYWFRIEIRKPDAGDPDNASTDDRSIIAAAMQYVQVTDEHESSPLHLERSILDKRTGAKGFDLIDTELTLFQDASPDIDTPYSAVIRILGYSDDHDEISLRHSEQYRIEKSGEGVLGVDKFWRLVPTDAKDTSPEEFQRAVRSLMFRFGNTHAASESVDNRRVFQFRFFDHIPPEDPKDAEAFQACLRELVIHPGILDQVHSRVGQLVGELCLIRSPDLKEVKQRFRTDVGFDDQNKSQAWEAIVKMLEDVTTASNPFDVDGTNGKKAISQVVVEVETHRQRPPHSIPLVDSYVDDLFAEFEAIDHCLITSLQNIIQNAFDTSFIPITEQLNALRIGETNDNLNVSTYLADFRNRINTTFATLIEQSQTTQGTTNIQALKYLATQYDAALSDSGNSINAQFDAMSPEFDLLEQELLRFGINLAASLLEIRQRFVDRLIDIRKARGAPFNSPKPEDKSVAIHLNLLLNKGSSPEEPAFTERLTLLTNALENAQPPHPNGVRNAADELKSTICNASRFQLGAFANDTAFESRDTGAETTLYDLWRRGGLSPLGRRSLQQILENWARFVGRIVAAHDDNAANHIPGPTPNLRRILASLAGDRPLTVAELGNLFAEDSDLLPQVIAAISPERRSALFALLRDVRNTPDELQEPKVYVLRSEANLFGWNAPENPLASVNAEQVANDLGIGKEKVVTLIEKMVVRLCTKKCRESEHPRHLFVEGTFKNTLPESVVAILEPQGRPEPYFVHRVEWHPRSAYELKGNVTHIELNADWWAGPTEPFDRLRQVRVLCDAERLELAEEPVKPQYLEASNEIELDQFVPGLVIDQPILLSGATRLSSTRTNTRESELLRVAGVRHNPRKNVYGDRLHTTVTLSRPLRKSYWRDSVTIYANVVEATHGESQQEVLGGGNSALEFQRFLLKKQPLTYLPGPSASGVEQALSVRVNDVAWQRRDNLNESRADSPHYITIPASEGGTQVVFGDGQNGARPSTGLDNIRASYRAGLGDAGNVAAQRIDQLVGAPLGVKGVINPLRAEGGADPDGADLLRPRTPLGLSALDRVVSTDDYADFARAFAGIGKATASLIDGIVYVSVGGMRRDPLGENSLLLNNLRSALAQHGDSLQQFRVLNREVALLLIQARVAIEPTYAWDDVERRARAALLDRFSYARAEFGRDVLRSDAITTIVNVEGVVYVDIDLFSSVSEQDATQIPPAGSSSSEQGSAADQPTSSPVQERARSLLSRIHVRPARLALANQSQDDSLARPLPDSGTERVVPTVRAAELCYLTPDVRDTLILEQIP